MWNVFLVSNFDAIFLQHVTLDTFTSYSTLLMKFLTLSYEVFHQKFKLGIDTTIIANFCIFPGNVELGDSCFLKGMSWINVKELFCGTQIILSFCIKFKLKGCLFFSVKKAVKMLFFYLYGCFCFICRSLSPKRWSTFWSEDAHNYLVSTIRICPKQYNFRQKQSLPHCHAYNTI